jgi:hypothetical protein
LQVRRRLILPRANGDRLRIGTIRKTQQECIRYDRALILASQVSPAGRSRSRSLSMLMLACRGNGADAAVASGCRGVAAMTWAGLVSALSLPADGALSGPPSRDHYAPIVSFSWKSPPFRHQFQSETGICPLAQCVRSGDCSLLGSEVAKVQPMVMHGGQVCLHFATCHGLFKGELLQCTP